MRWLFALLFAGCATVPVEPQIRIVSHGYASPGIDYVTTHGVRVTANAVPISREKLEELTECFLEICRLIVPDGMPMLVVVPACQDGALQALRDSRLEWVEDASGEGVFVGGEKVGGARRGNEVFVAWSPGQPLSKTSLFHEWAHLALGAKDGEDEDIWKVVEQLKEDCK